MHAAHRISREATKKKAEEKLVYESRGTMPRLSSVFPVGFIERQASDI